LSAAGRRIVTESVRELATQHAADWSSPTAKRRRRLRHHPSLAQELLEAGIDVLTGGNHTFDRRIFCRTSSKARPADACCVRPTIPPPPAAASISARTKTGTPYAVLNIQGRVFMPTIDCPFKAADRLLAELPADVKVKIVDMHAETTSEKQAIGSYLDGRVSAVLGTHTHVPTADDKILPKGTAYITDVGMTGPYDSVIGNNVDGVLRRFLTGLPTRLDVAEGDVRLCGAVLDIDESSGRARSLQPIRLREKQQ
jgi:metallophosphoesterase (TIGR00282 family)